VFKIEFWILFDVRIVSRSILFTKSFSRDACHSIYFLISFANSWRWHHGWMIGDPAIGLAVCRAKAAESIA
jgi:hypothetical protein